MAKRYTPAECPEWGPMDGCHYNDEDTGRAVAFCCCGSHNPNLVKRRTTIILDPEDNPPF